jgi:peptidoglycan LD-endopeptidase LytH
MMLRRPSESTLHDLRTFAAGAGCGLCAGAFIVAAIVWQFGNVIGTRAAAIAHPPEVPKAVERWADGLDDAGSGVLDRADEPRPGVTGTSGSAAASGGPAPVPPLPASSLSEDVRDLARRDLEIPVENVRPEQLTRQFDQLRDSTRRHEALDILAPRNTPVRAVEDGRIAKLFLSKAGGITIYQFDPSERYCYYYAHLERYADGLHEGQQVSKGQVIGYVGTSGNAPKNTPHLHFAVFRLTPDKHWWEGTPLDPFDILR